MNQNAILRPDLSFRSKRGLRPRLEWLIRQFVPSISYPICLAAIFLSPFNSFIVAGKYQIGDLLFIAAALALVPGMVAGRVRLWMPWWFAVSGVALGASFVVRIFADSGVGSHEDNLSTAYAALAGLVVPVVVASQPIKSPGQVTQLVYALIFGSLACAVIAVLQHHRIDLYFLNKYLVWYGSRASGLNAHPNTLGFYAAMVAPLCLALAFGAHSLSVRVFVLWTAAIGVAFYAIDLSGSRTSLVGGVLGCASVMSMFVLLRRRSENVIRYLRVIAVIAGVVVALQFLGDREESALNRLFGDSSSALQADAERAELAQISSDAFWRNPIAGHGYQHADKKDSAHNLWLAAMECGGLLGLLSVLIQQAGMIRYSFKLVKDGIRDPHKFAMAVGFSALYLVWLLHGIKESHLLHRNVYAALGLIVLLCIYERTQRSNGVAPL